MRTGGWLVLLTALVPAVAVAERGAVTRSLPAPAAGPTGLAYDGRLLWLADRREDRLLALDPASGEVVRTLPAPSHHTVGLAFDGKSLWAVDGQDKVAHRVDPATGASDHRVELEAAVPRGLAWREGHLIVADDGRGVIHEVDPEDGATLRTIPAPLKGTTGIAFAAGALFVANRLEDAVFAVDFDSGDVLFGFPAPGPYAFGMATVGEDLAVVDYQRREVSFVSLVVGERPYRTWGGRRVKVEYTMELRNLGPDPVSSAEVFVAVPESRPYQELHGPVTFDPAPAGELKMDGGGRVARFAFAALPGGASARVVMRAEVTLRNLRFMVLPGDVGTLGEVPKDIARLYTRDGAKLLISDPLVRETAAKLAAGGPDLLTLVRRTYDHVLARMSYDLSGGWNAAPMILQRGTGSCSEYSFALMALLRANGIPARYVGSLVVRGDDASWDDVYHRWVEVFLPRVGWFPLDANKGDKPSPRERATGFGELDDRLLVTTESPGGADPLGWTYNVRARWRCAGRCKVVEDGVADFGPAPAP